MNKKVISIIVGIIVIGGVFYGGMQYEKSKVPAQSQYGNGTFTRGSGGIGGTRGSGSLGGLTTGQIVSKDSQSITVSLASGGSKIIFLDTNTKISKQTTGTLTDLAVGTQVSVTGVANADGSINAQSVQIRPAGTTQSGSSSAKTNQ
jgi:hypothetical protein